MVDVSYTGCTNLWPADVDQSQNYNRGKPTNGRPAHTANNNRTPVDGTTVNNPGAVNHAVMVTLDSEDTSETNLEL